MKIYAGQRKDTLSNVARGKRLSQRRSIQISTTLFLKYFVRNLSYAHFLFLTPTFLSMHIIHAHTIRIRTTRAGMHSYRPMQSGNGYICRLHGSHSARPMERERHFNLPAYYFMTFLMTYFFVVFPEGRGVSSFIPSTTSKLTN